MLNSNIQNKFNKKFNFDINELRKNYYQKVSQNEINSTSSVTENKNNEKDNEEKIIKSNETIIIVNEKVDKKGKIDIDSIKNNIDYDSNENLSTNNSTGKSENKKPTPAYYIPFKKIFKEDKKEIDIDELKYNNDEEKNTKKTKLYTSDKPIRKEPIENPNFININSNNKAKYLNPGFPGFNTNEFNSNNILNLQNNSNYYLELYKIIQAQNKFNELLQKSLRYIYDVGNTNNHLKYLLINNDVNNYNNLLNINQFNPFNNNINYYGNNIFGNIFPNNNIINSLQNQKNINSFNNINNPENYTITFKSKTNDPTIEKVAKIQVTMSFVKDNSKVKPEKNDNPKSQNIKNLININDIINGKEKRTVIRLNPIPPNYSSFDVCKLLDMYLKTESGKNQRIYKALYTPLCKVIGKNLGYCFVMMVKPKYVIDFYNTFNGRIFGKKKCKKPCKVIWADIQGEEFLKASEDDPIRKPIIFKDIIIDKED